MDFIAYAIAVEEISRVDASTSIGMSVHTSLCSWPIYKYGTEEQKQKYLVPQAKGEKLACFGLTEPGGGFGQCAVGVARSSSKYRVPATGLCRYRSISRKPSAR